MSRPGLPAFRRPGRNLRLPWPSATGREIHLSSHPESRVPEARTEPSRTRRLRELVAPYLAACATFNAPSTVDRKRSILEHLCAALGDRELAAIGPADVERYRWRRRDAVSGGCVNRELATLSHLFNWARRLGHCEHNPVREVPRFPENRDAWMTLTPGQAERLLEACRQADARAAHLYPLVLLALYTGLRRGEVLELRWRQVDLEAGTLAVGRAKTTSRTLMPLHPRVRATLGELHRAAAEAGRAHDDDLVLCHPNGAPLRDPRASFHTALSRAGLPRIRWHDLRHTFASWLVLGGADLFTVQELMGHANLAMTRRYAHLSMGHKREALARLPERVRQA